MIVNKNILIIFPSLSCLIIPIHKKICHIVPDFKDTKQHIIHAKCDFLLSYFDLKNYIVQSVQ
jgi:hypothetical protein